MLSIPKNQAKKLIDDYTIKNYDLVGYRSYKGFGGYTDDRFGYTIGKDFIPLYYWSNESNNPQDTQQPGSIMPKNKELIDKFTVRDISDGDIIILQNNNGSYLGNSVIQSNERKEGMWSYVQKFTEAGNRLIGVSVFIIKKIQIIHLN